MASLNKVILVGNLTRDPELRYTSSGAAVARMGLAVNRRYTTAQGEERDETCFIDIDVWGKQAESCERYLRKGSPALIEGRLTFDQWEDRETGQKRSKHSVRAERVQFLGAPRNDAMAAPQGNPQQVQQPFYQQAQPAPQGYGQQPQQQRGGFQQQPQQQQGFQQYQPMPPFQQQASAPAPMPQQAKPAAQKEQQAPAPMPPFEPVEEIDDDIPF